MLFSGILEETGLELFSGVLEEIGLVLFSFVLEGTVFLLPFGVLEETGFVLFFGVLEEIGLVLLSGGRDDGPGTGMNTVSAYGGRVRRGRRRCSGSVGSRRGVLPLRATACGARERWP